MRINRIVLITELVKRDMRDKQLVELSGISRATLSAVKGGKTIAPSTAQKIAAALNVPFEKLIK
jgi:putative transcriptional regulator